MITSCLGHAVRNCSKPAVVTQKPGGRGESALDQPPEVHRLPAGQGSVVAVDLVQPERQRLPASACSQPEGAPQVNVPPSNPRVAFCWKALTRDGIGAEGILGAWDARI